MSEASLVDGPQLTAGLQAKMQTYNCGIGMALIFDKETTIDPEDELIKLGEIIKSEDSIVDYQLIETSFN